MPSGIKFTVRVNDTLLQRKIIQMSRATGRTVKDETRRTMKGIISDVIDFTPPSSQKTHGLAARAAGEVSIVRDMKKLFIPVTLKHKRPEQWPDPHALHHEAMVQAGGNPVRTPTVKFHVDKAKITSLKNLLRPNVGRMASGWVAGAQALGAPVPAWIARHGTGRGSNLLVTESDTKIVMQVINHFPGTADKLAAQTQRLVAFAKKAAIGSLTRQLPYILKKNLRAI